MQTPAFSGPTATNLLPSADEAMEDHSPKGALVIVQVWATTEFKPHQAAAISSKILMGFI